jgi:hypothetical protein
MVKFRKPFQIIAQPLYEGPGLVLKYFVLVMIADLCHVNKLIEDLKTFRHSEIEFHPFTHGRRSKIANKEIQKLVL